MIQRRYATTHAAYRGTLEQVYWRWDSRTSPRGLRTREVFDYSFKVMRPTSEPIRTDSETRNKVIADYTAKEFALYNSMDRNAATWGKIAKFWNGIANPDGTVNSAYGWLIFGDRSCGDPPMNGQPLMTPWEWALKSLTSDRDTRQAYLRISQPKHQWIGNKDQVCTMHVTFRIVDGFLRASTVMRSNDVVRGLVYDMPYFVSLQERMVEELRATAYPDLLMGSYTHFAHSMHMYDRDEETVRMMLGQPYLRKGDMDDGQGDRRGEIGDDQEPEHREGVRLVGPDDGGDRPPHRDDLGGATGGDRRRD